MHLAQDLAFPSSERLSALELGFQCGAMKGEKSANSRFFFCVWRFCFFAHMVFLLVPSPFFWLRARERIKGLVLNSRAPLPSNHPVLDTPVQSH
jgi:hypothetical protein